ncbi:methyltransferase domain-containing protein [Sphaerotilus sp.]|uniref:methyltransferase domain-containing protein n=1 Tax=Sphaerotilus sp. TaxID=2093942 RepID=UPI0034E287EA
MDVTLDEPSTGIAALRATHATQSPCKCCGANARLSGFVDFDRDCFGYNAQRGQIRGLPIAYYRCAECEFAFTEAFDGWSPAQYQAHIYNDEYTLFDPNFATERPQNTCRLVQQLIHDRSVRILDYGSGNGHTARLLREAGYAHVTEYDPFHGDPVKPAQGGFDLVICIEVAEHVPDPLRLFAELNSYSADHGILMLSTKDMAEVQGNWVNDWYVAPRNGHISFYSSRTLTLLGNSLNRSYRKLDSFRHLLMPKGA